MVHLLVSEENMETETENEGTLWKQCHRSRRRIMITMPTKKAQSDEVDRILEKLKEIRLRQV